MSVRVLVTGGSGFLGINLVRYLHSKNYDVSSIDLVEFDYVDCKDRVNAIQGDIRDVPTLERAMQGADFVIHCAAALPLYPEADIMSTDVQGTRNVLDAAWKHGVKRVVHISTTAVYGVPDHHPLYEHDPLIGVGPYGKAKILAEGECMKDRAQGRCVTIIRPKSFIGPERLGVFALLYDWAKDGKNFPLPGGGDNLYQLLDVEDLCVVLEHCLAKPESVVNDTFNIGAKVFGTVRQDFQAVLDEAGKGKKIIGIPEGPMNAALALLRLLRLSPVYKWAYGTVAKESFVSVEKAENVLSFAPRYSNKDALLRNYHWYLANVKRFEGQSGVSHRVPWSQGFLKVLKPFF